MLTRIGVLFERLRRFGGQLANPLRASDGSGRSRFGGRATAWARGLVRALARLVDLLVDPLRIDEEPNHFRLSSAETATTTYDGDVGWEKRPPAVLRCPRCDAGVLQHNARDGIDCPRCVAAFPSEEFTDLELRYMICPVCRSRMEHGQRHPERFDIPEWATCDECRYHWEFKHSY